VVHKTPELLEVCKQAQEAGGSILKDGLPQGLKDAKDMLSFVLTIIVSVVGLNYAVRTNGFTTFANSLSQKKLKHIAAQNEPTEKDIKALNVVSKFCKTLQVTPEKVTEGQKTEMAIKDKTAFHALWEADESRKKGGQVLTEGIVNLHGLRIVDLEAPARFEKNKGKELDQNLLKQKENPTEWERINNRLKRDLRKKRSQRARLDDYNERKLYDERNPRRTRLSLKDAIVSNMDWVNWNIEGADLSGANMSNTAILISNLRKAELVKAKAENASWIKTDIHGAVAQGIYAPQLSLFKVDGKYTDFSPYYENGSYASRKTYQPSVLRGMKIRNIDYNPVDKQYVLAEKNDFRRANFNGADLSESEWNNVNVQDATFKTPVITPPDEVLQRMPNHEARINKLTGKPIWETIVPKPTNFSGAIWRNVEPEGAKFKGAVMENMRFPTEIHTLDDIQEEFLRPRFRKNPQGWLKYAWEKDKVGIPAEEARYVTPYLIPSNMIRFSGADLSETRWKGTVLNEKSRLSGKVENRVTFAGATLDGADFREAVILNPYNPQQGYRIKTIAKKWAEAKNDEEKLKALEPQLKQLGLIFGNSLEKISVPPRLSMFRYEDAAFAKEVSNAFKTSLEN
jgi:uncharacterized protein YjbI with pentapeptide repeats